MPTIHTIETCPDRKIQAFDRPGEIIPMKREEAFEAYLIEWAKMQPKSTLGFIDVAAGAGIEAGVLSFAGFTCIAEDPSSKMLQQSSHPQSNIGTAEHLRYPDCSFSGVLIKDAWLFLSPLQRNAFFAEAFRVLVPGGSVLVRTQREDIHRARYQPKDGQFPQNLPSSDFVSYSAWLEGIERLRVNGDQVLDVEYLCLPPDIAQMAAQHGFVEAQQVCFTHEHPMAKENRWIKKSGFIIVLEKSSK